MAFLGDASGAAPSGLSNAAPWLIPVDQQHLSGAAINTLTFQLDLDTLGDRYQDINVPLAVDRLVELREVGNGGVGRLRGWGKLAANSITASARNELSTITCRLDDTALETKPVRFALHYDNIFGGEVEVETDLLFNPLEQTTPRGNRSSNMSADGFYYFLDPGSVRSKQALDLQMQTPARWTLAEAAHVICWHCNPDETRLINPSLAELQAVLDDATRDAQFVNHVISLGSGLLAALDSLLRPYSCGFYLDWSGALGNVETRIKVFELGDGLSEDCRLQRIGDSIDSRKTDVEDLQMRFDIAAQPNRIHAVGARKLLELTLNLYPGWDPADDPTGAANGYLDEYDELAKNPDYQPDGRFGHVGRRWTANEAGDYDTFRPSQVAAQALPGCDRLVRRPLLPCLTRAADGGQVGDHGIYLEWKDFDDQWHEETAAFDVLGDEAGIMYSGLPPIEVWFEYLARGDTYNIRVTATIELDDRVAYQTSRRTDSPQGVDHWLYLPLERRFADRRLHESGPQKSRFFDDRGFTLLAAAENTGAGGWDLTLDSSAADKVQPGQKLAIIDSTREGIYTVKEVNSSIVTVCESAAERPLFTGTTHRVLLNTDAEGCVEQIKSFALQARDDNDYALVTPSIDLAGIDHPQYEIGKLVPNAQPRNVSFAGRRGGARAPQIMGLHYRFQGGQHTTLQLEQVREVAK